MARKSSTTTVAGIRTHLWSLIRAAANTAPNSSARTVAVPAALRVLSKPSSNWFWIAVYWNWIHRRLSNCPVAFSR